jgi:hypothetical protein
LPNAFAGDAVLRRTLATLAEHGYRNRKITGSMPTDRGHDNQGKAPGSAPHGIIPLSVAPLAHLDRPLRLQ